jgi:WD40 repeat protein/nucleoside phosphorylase
MLAPEIKSLGEVRGQIDFGIITMREDELTAVLARFQPQWLVMGNAHYNIGVLHSRRGRSFHVAIVRTAGQGHAAAQKAATALYHEIDPACFVLIGIAGAKPEPEFTLGDVIVGTRFYDFSVGAALSGGKTETSDGGAPIHPLVQAAAVNLPAVAGLLGEWNTEAAIGRPVPPVVLDPKNFRGDADWRDQVRSSLSRQFPESGPVRPRLVTAGALASANVLMKDPARFKRWLDHGRDIKGVEMELPGVAEAVRSVLGDRPVLAVRGFSDVVGFKRDPGWTEYACHSAASFAHAFLTADLLNLEPKPKMPPAGRKATADAKGRTRLVRSGPAATVSGGDTEPVAAPVGQAAADLVRVEQMEVLQHEDAVLWAAFSPDGGRIVTAGKDTARLWDADGGAVAELRGHKPGWGIRHAVFSHNGRLIATASSDGTARLWDAGTGSALRTLAGHQDGVSLTAFSPDDRRIVTASSDNTAILWDTETGAMLVRLSPGEGWVHRAVFSPDGQRIATASLGNAGEGRVHVWDGETGQRLGMLRGSQDTLWDVAFSPDGKRILTGSLLASPRIWSGENYRRLMILSGHAGNVLEVAYSPDGRHMLTAGPNETHVWDAETGAGVAVLPGAVEGAAFSPDSRWVVTAGKDGVARLWDAADGRRLATLHGHEGGLWCAAFSPDGARLVTASMDGTALIWRLGG